MWGAVGCVYVLEHEAKTYGNNGLLVIIIVCVCLERCAQDVEFFFSIDAETMVPPAK